MQDFRETILNFYRDHGRSLPWRDTDNHYHIFVSEIMLQQTGVERVLGKYLRFLTEFPDFGALARASQKRILSEWQGLGYNRRCIHLREGARKICSEFSGKLPESEKLLLSLPGVGRATSRALLAFCFNRPVVFLETNIRQVFIHFFFQESGRVSDTEMLPLVAKTLDRNNPREWYYALMDYGTMLKRSIGNLVRKSAGYRQPAPFEGSMRQVRGIILKTLLSSPGLTPDRISSITGIDTGRIKEALDRLTQEGFLENNGLFYSLCG
ncbi:MAG TPA: A/G-specific adenine glycosylase [Spirochaetota bacterium]|nr:A/G-specific adenine glycosylase [Spirochaetota bacterium]